MLIIRKEQMKVLEEYGFQNFQDRVFSHLMRVFSEQCQEKGESAVRVSIEKGIELAANYNITSQNDVVGFIDLMYIHGWDFDRDPTMHWAATILQDPNLHPRRKMERLYEMTEQELGVPPKNL